MMTLRMRIQDRLTLTALKATANQTTPTQTLSNHRRRRGDDATTGMVVRRKLERDSIGEGDLPRSKRNQVLMTSQSILNSNRCSSSHLCSNQSQRLSRHPRRTSARRWNAWERLCMLSMSSRSGTLLTKSMSSRSRWKRTRRRSRRRMTELYSGRCRIKMERLRNWTRLWISFK